MIAIEVTPGRAVVTEIGTTAPFSAISGASRLTLSETSGVLPYSALRAPASVFCENASFGHLLASAAARARLIGAAPTSPSVARPPASAPCMTLRRVWPRRVLVLLLMLMLSKSIAKLRS